MDATEGFGVDCGVECVGYQAHDQSGHEHPAMVLDNRFNYGAAFEKGMAIGAGQCPVKRYNRALRDLIIHGRATPWFIVSHELGLDEAVDAYANFDARKDGWTKVLLHPAA
jgi:glutathione-independent formaldehyde dehydrogenase